MDGFGQMLPIFISHFLVRINFSARNSSPSESTALSKHSSFWRKTRSVMVWPLFIFFFFFFFFPHQINKKMLLCPLPSNVSTRWILYSFVVTKPGWVKTPAIFVTEDLSFKLFSFSHAKKVMSSSVRWGQEIEGRKILIKHILYREKLEKEQEISWRLTTVLTVLLMVIAFISHAWFIGSGIKWRPKFTERSPECGFGIRSYAWFISVSIIYLLYAWWCGLPCFISHSFPKY